MDPQERRDGIKTLSQTMSTRMNVQSALNTYVKEFSNRLFSAIEGVLADLEASGTPGLGKSRRLAHPAGGREGLQVFVEDWSIIFVPLPGLARPNSLDEARIPPAQFKENCGRIGVFLTDEPQVTAFYDFLIFQDGSWFAWGYGWPKQQSDIESTDFEALALELIRSFTKDIFITWHARSQTVLSTALDAKKRAHTFGLPGEDQQGR